MAASSIRTNGTLNGGGNRKEIPKELLRKAAEGVLISSFMDLNLHSPQPNGSLPLNSKLSTTIRQHTTAKFSSSSSRSPGHQSQQAVIEIDLSENRTGQSLTSVFVKVIPHSAKRCLNEVKFYNEIVPVLYPPSALRFPKSIPAIPECYLTHENGQSFIFLENLNVLGFKNCGPAEDTVFDFNHTLLAVETLARFHAQSYFLLRQLGSKARGRLALSRKFPWLQHYEFGGKVEPGGNRYSRVYSSFFEQIILKIAEYRNPSLALKLKRKYPVPDLLYSKIGELLEKEKHENDDFYVICHGDFRTDNLMFKYGLAQGVEPGEPVECRIVDLKNARIAPLATDLIYLMFTSLGPKTRDEFEEKLIAFYCDTFESHLSSRYRQEGLELKPEDFNIEMFHRKVEEQYRRMLEYGFLVCVTALPLSSTGFSSGVLENLEEIHLNGQDQSVFHTLENSDKFQQFAKECLSNMELKNAILGIIEKLLKTRILL